MEQGLEICCHQKNADIIDLRLLCRQGRADLIAGHHKGLHMIAHQDIRFLLLL